MDSCCLGAQLTACSSFPEFLSTYDERKPMPEVQCNTKDLLASIINGTDICTLCLKSIEEDSYDLYDEVVFQAGSGANVLFVDVLSSLLALQVTYLVPIGHLVMLNA